MSYKEISGQRLKSARLALPRDKPHKAVTQEAVARAAGMDAPRYANYEQGIRSPDPDAMIALAKVLKEPACYLAGLVNDEGLITIMRAYESTNHAGRDSILAAVAKVRFGREAATEMTDSFSDGEDGRTSPARRSK